MRAGWRAITNAATGLSRGLHFDPAVFPCCWLFASYGGRRNLNVAVLEPCTGYPLNFEALLAAGRQKILQPQESFSTNMLFTVQPGIRSVSSIDADGTMIGERPGRAKNLQEASGFGSMESRIAAAMANTMPAICTLVKAS